MKLKFIILGELWLVIFSLEAIFCENCQNVFQCSLAWNLHIVQVKLSIF